MPSTWKKNAHLTNPSIMYCDFLLLCANRTWVCGLDIAIDAIISALILTSSSSPSVEKVSTVTFCSPDIVEELQINNISKHKDHSRLDKKYLFSLQSHFFLLIFFQRFLSMFDLFLHEHTVGSLITVGPQNEQSAGDNIIIGPCMVLCCGNCWIICFSWKMNNNYSLHFPLFCCLGHQLLQDPCRSHTWKRTYQLLHMTKTRDHFQGLLWKGKGHL